MSRDIISNKAERISLLVGTEDISENEMFSIFRPVSTIQPGIVSRDLFLSEKLLLKLIRKKRSCLTGGGKKIPAWGVGIIEPEFIQAQGAKCQEGIVRAAPYSIQQNS
jgi:hypothetical protein